MNKTYLSKLIAQETINVKIQLIKEHIEIAREEHIRLLENAFNADTGLLSEQASTDQTIWPAATKKTQDFLKAIPGATEETRGSNLVAYDVTVNIPAMDGAKAYKNLFTFYEDGAVYDFNLMVRFGYTYDDNKKLITIQAKNPGALISLADNTSLATINKAGKFTSLAYDAEQPKSTFDKPKEMPWLDTLQTVLDFAGLIPVIGDALDVINAIIYFWRDKYFEGFLSLVAIIPVVGSVISLGVKGALKGAQAALFSNKLIGRWWLKGEPKAVQEFVELLMKNGVSAKDIRTIAQTFGGFGSMLRNASKGIPNIAGGGTVANNLDNAGSKLSIFMEAADKALKAASKSIPATIVPKAASRIWKTPKAVANFLTFGLLPRIQKMPWFPTKQLAAMAATTEKRFISKSIQSPEKLSYLTKFGGVRQRKAIANDFASKYKLFGNKEAGAVGAANVAAINRAMNSTPALKKMWKDNRGVIDWDDMLQSATKTQDFMTNLAKQDPKLAEDFGKTIANQAVANNNILWNTFKESTTNKIISSQSSIVLKTQFAKNVDWIWNEMQMAGETLGFESSEHLGDVGLVPLAKWAVASSMPGTYASMQAARDGIVGLGAAATDVLNVAANAYGIQLPTLDEYPPLGAEQYTYQQDEEV